MSKRKIRQIPTQALNSPFDLYYSRFSCDSRSQPQISIPVLDCDCEFIVSFGDAQRNTQTQISVLVFSHLVFQSLIHRSPVAALRRPIYLVVSCLTINNSNSTPPCPSCVRIHSFLKQIIINKKSATPTFTGISIRATSTFRLIRNPICSVVCPFLYNLFFADFELAGFRVAKNIYIK